MDVKFFLTLTVISVAIAIVSTQQRAQKPQKIVLQQTECERNADCILPTTCLNREKKCGCVKNDVDCQNAIKDCTSHADCVSDFSCNKTEGTGNCHCNHEAVKKDQAGYWCVDQKFVEPVTQNYKPNTNDLIVAQVRKELQASYLYQAYASYFQRADVALPGVQKFFAAAAVEERDHAQMLIDYINERGGHAHFEDITLAATCDVVRDDQQAKKANVLGDNPEKPLMCICNFVTKGTHTETCGERDDWKNALMGFIDALATERYVNQQLLELHREASELNDAHLTHILEHNFLEEQVKSINELAHHVFKLKKFAKSTQSYYLGEYMFDQNLK